MKDFVCGRLCLLWNHHPLLVVVLFWSGISLFIFLLFFLDKYFGKSRRLST